MTLLALAAILEAIFLRIALPVDLKPRIVETIGLLLLSAIFYLVCVAGVAGGCWLLDVRCWLNLFQFKNAARSAFSNQHPKSSIQYPLHTRPIVRIALLSRLIFLPLYPS